MQKNDEIFLEITDVSSDGSGIGRYNGIAVFVPLTAVGDKIKVHITKVKKAYAYGRLVSLEKPSAARTENDCPVFSRCGGCVYRHISYESECALKKNQVENAIRRIGGIHLPSMPIIPADNPNGYRNKAQFPFSQSGGVGFYANHSHRIIECNRCCLQPDEFAGIADAVTGWIKHFSVSVYNEENHSGLIRHLYLRKGYRTGELMVTLVINGSDVPGRRELINRLKSVFPEHIKSIQLNFNTDNTNVILGGKCETIYGDDYISDEICGIKVRISPLSFYQVNPQMTERLYKKAAEYAKPDGKNILDLYCGAGIIGMSMAAFAKSVTGIEIIPDAVEDAKQNALKNRIANARFICADAAAAARQLAKENFHADVVIVDPPRKGCERSVLQTVSEAFAPERIVYISCDPATLARDSAILGEFGYALKEYTPVDMFPRTAHVETVALLSKLEAKQHIDIDLNMDELDLTAAESKATYDEIKAYVLKTTGLKVSHLNIAHVKRKYGIIERGNYNEPKSENSRQPRCTPEKEQAVKAALKHFNMIQDDKQ